MKTVVKGATGEPGVAVFPTSVDAISLAEVTGECALPTGSISAWYSVRSLFRQRSWGIRRAYTPWRPAEGKEDKNRTSRLKQIHNSIRIETCKQSKEWATEALVFRVVCGEKLLVRFFFSIFTKIHHLVLWERSFWGKSAFSINKSPSSIKVSFDTT